MLYSSLMFLLTIQDAFILMTRGDDSEDCWGSLTKFMESDGSIYQSFVIYENMFNNPTVMKEVDRNFHPNTSIMMIDRFVSEDHIVYQLPSTKAPRPGTLFSIWSSNMSYIKNILNHLNETMWSAHHPKILLISWDVNNEKILEYAWTKQLVDVTLMQIIFNRTFDHFSFQFNFSITIVVKQFNPFTKLYDILECSPKTVWFPNKIRNLHGYILRVAMVQHPPFSIIKRNSTGHIVEISGTEANVLLFLAKGLNFHPKIFELSFYDPHYFDDLDADQLLAELRTGEVDLIANDRVYRPKPESKIDYESTYPVFVDDYCLVVPIIRIEEISSLDDHFLAAFICIVSVVLIDMIIACCCHFDRRIWNFTNMVEMLLGVSVPKQPYKSAERIIFIFLVFFSMTYSQNVLSTLTKIELKQLKEVEFKELNDILEYKLTPQADYSVISNDTFLDISDYLGNTHKVVIQKWNSRNLCLKMLIKNKNVTCLMGRTVGKLSVFTSTINHDEQVMKIMNDCPWASSTRMILKKGSPYLREINIILSLAKSSGIIKRFVANDLSDLKFQEEIIKHTRKSDIENESERLNRSLLFKIVLSGFCISTIAFSMEIFCNRISSLKRC